MNQPTEKVSGLAQQSVWDMSNSQRAISRLSEVNYTGNLDNEVARDLVSDSFPALFFGELPERERPERVLNSTIFKYANEHLEKARGDCKGKIVSSSYTAPLLAGALLADDFIQDCLKKQNEANELEKQAQEAEQKAQESGSNEDKQAAGAARQAANDAQNKVNVISQKLGADKMTQTSIRNAAKKANEAAKDVKDLMAGWGDDEPKFDTSDVEGIQNFIKALNSDTSRVISKILGHLRGVALTARRSKVTTSIKPTGCELTQDFDRIFPDELARLFSDEFSEEDKFSAWMDYYDYGLLGWEKKAHLSEFGDFHVYVDKSGSMGSKSMFEGESYPNEQIATGLAIAVAQATKRQGRNYSITVFSDICYNYNVLTNKHDLAQSIEWAQFNPAGGTNFNAVVQSMIERSDIENSDYLIITDDLFYADNLLIDRFMEAKKDRGLRLLSINLGKGTHRSQIEEISDLVINVDDLNDSESLARKIATWVR